MSIEAMAWVLKSSPVAGMERFVLLAIASHADRDGENAWPTQEAIAQECGITSRAVRNITDRLTAAGCLIRQDRAHKKGRTSCHVYAVAMRNAVPVVRGYQPERDARKPVPVVEAPRPEPHDTDDRNLTTPHKDEPSKEPSSRESLPTVETPAAQGPAKRYTPEADAVAREVWDSLEPKPLTAFPRVRERVSEAMEAGWAPLAIQRAAANVHAWTQPGLEFALRHSGAISSPRPLAENPHDRRARERLQRAGLVAS